MPTLTLQLADELAARFYSEDQQIRDVTSQYSRQEIIAFLRDNVRQMQAEVEGMTPAQLAYRLPGTPTGPDKSGDETHFDTSEIVTHTATGTAFHWWNITRALRDERPPMPKPPAGTPTTGKKIMGAGGWRGASGPELARLLGDTVEGFLSYVNGVPEDAEATSSIGPFRDLTPHDWLFLVAVHTAMHLNQIRHIKAQVDYPRGLV